MFEMRFGGTVHLEGESYDTEDFGYARRPYQLFMPVCEKDLSGVVTAREDGPLAISIPAARPVWHHNTDIDWSDRMRFEGYCKNAFWLIFELYRWTDIAAMEIPIYIATNESGWPRVAQYAELCGFPTSQIIVHADVVPGTRKPSELAHIVKFETLAHERLSRFECVLHIDASTRVREETPDCIWESVLEEWPRSKPFAHGRESVWGEGNMMTFLVQNMDEAKEMTGIEDVGRVTEEFYNLKQWPRVYGQCFGGTPDFWRRADLAQHLTAAEKYAYTDEDSLAIALIALGIGDAETHSLSVLPEFTLKHMEPFLVPQNSDALKTQAGFMESCAFTMRRHGAEMQMYVVL